jgi:hypothetical protein
LPGLLAPGIVPWQYARFLVVSIYVKAENIDSMKLEDKLNAISKLCSKQGKYCMNFDQNPNRENLTNLCIFGQGRDTWLVWVANRNRPVY